MPKTEPIYNPPGIGSKPKNGSKPERETTKRVVLKRERVLVLGDGVSLADIAACADEKALRKMLVGQATTPVTYEIEAWVPVGTFDGDSKTKAIEAYAGKPGTADAKAGAYRAPTTSAWAGGIVYEQPPVPLFQRRALDDAHA